MFEVEVVVNDQEQVMPEELRKWPGKHEKRSQIQAQLLSEWRLRISYNSALNRSPRTYQMPAVGNMRVPTVTLTDGRF